MSLVARCGGICPGYLSVIDDVRLVLRLGPLRTWLWFEPSVVNYLSSDRHRGRRTRAALGTVVSALIFVALILSAGAVVFLLTQALSGAQTLRGQAKSSAQLLALEIGLAILTLVCICAVVFAIILVEHGNA